MISVGIGKNKRDTTCHVNVRCDLCGQMLQEDIFTAKHSASKTLSNTEQIQKDIKTKFKIMLRYMFDNHFCVSNQLEAEKGKCSGMTSRYMEQLTEARDKEMYTLGNDVYSESFGYTIFKNLILLLLHCHMEGKGIINYFSWQNMSSHTKNRGIRLSSVVDITKKNKLTVDTVIGNNIEEIQEKIL